MGKLSSITDRLFGSTPSTIGSGPSVSIDDPTQVCIETAEQSLTHTECEMVSDTLLESHTFDDSFLKDIDIGLERVKRDSSLNNHSVTNLRSCLFDNVDSDRLDEVVANLYQHLYRQNPVCDVLETIEEGERVGHTDTLLYPIGDFETKEVTVHTETFASSVDIIEQSVTDVLREFELKRANLSFDEIQTSVPTVSDDDLRLRNESFTDIISLYEMGIDLFYPRAIEPHTVRNHKFGLHDYPEDDRRLSSGEIFFVFDRTRFGVEFQSSSPSVSIDFDGSGPTLQTCWRGGYHVENADSGFLVDYF